MVKTRGPPLARRRKVEIYWSSWSVTSTDDGDEERVFVRELNADESTLAAEERAFRRRLPTRRHRRPRRPRSRRLIGNSRADTREQSHLVTTHRRRGDASAVGDAAGNVQIAHLQRGVKAGPPRRRRRIEASPAPPTSLSLPLPDFPDENVLAVLESNANVRFHAQSSGDALGTTMVPKNAERGIIHLFTPTRSTSAASTSCPFGRRRRVGFAPPTSFAYKFLASEFEVDDEVDVDAEDAILSTDEEEPEPDLRDDGRRGDPKFTANARHRPPKTPFARTTPSDVLEANGSRFARRVSTKNRFAPRSSRERTTTARRSDTGRATPGGSRRHRARTPVTYAVPSLREIGAFGPVPAASNADVAGGSRGGCVSSSRTTDTRSRDSKRFDPGDAPSGRGCRDRPRGSSRARPRRARGEIGDGGERSELARETSPRRRGDAAGEERGAHHRRTALVSCAATAFEN